MRITLEISDETYRQYASKHTCTQFANKIKDAILKELRTEVSCGMQVVKTIEYIESTEK